ncbi:hypothetical protein ONS95_008952 [Cadophora gregata]|uniref:uncharacterized protein n=1 Tax=Cadophora gregata TaxID=51156 RepID=UPI0026DD950F|nr:uncharacterized protein ONS95_008952 [Cadophora gregata]KAK0123964.1 hypothetical protein ONS95_008952 [Cadophora gregata]KAK0130303.1 hypothetical protein ONS96_000824 [Cadophora gregata f. sp. sojae]
MSLICVRRRVAAQAYRYASQKAAITSIIYKRSLHEYLVMVNDTKAIKNLGPQVKATFAGEVLEESSSPKSIFACRAASVKAVEEALKESGDHDMATVKIFPLETVHTSALEGS